MRFAYPWVLLFLPLLGGLSWLLYRFSKKAAHKRLAKFSPPSRLMNLLGTVDFQAKKWKFILFASALGFLLLAAARPLIGPKKDTADQSGVDFFIILDVSKSMWVRDVEPDRLSAVKKSLAEWLKSRAGDRVGLILMAGDSFIQAPLTSDYSAFRGVLAQSSPKAISLGGTNISHAIQLAVKTFNKLEKVKDRVVIIVSDGESLDGHPMEDARLAHANDKLTIYTVGVGTAEGGLVPSRDLGAAFKGPIKEVIRDEYGIPVHSRLDERTLRSVASAGGGKYFSFEPDVWEKLYEQELKQNARKMDTLNINDYNELFQIPLFLALALFIADMAISTRLKVPRRPKSAVSLPDPSPPPTAMKIKSKTMTAKPGKQKPPVAAKAR